MTNHLSLAFASFHFQVTDHAPKHFTGSEYLQWIRDALEGVATATDIEIESESKYREARFVRPDAKALKRFDELSLHFPRLQFVRITFDLRVPGPFQAQLRDRGLHVDPRLGEDFSVVLSDGWQTSVAMVRPLNETQLDPTDAVIVVREFLEQEFEPGGGHNLSFQTLGPSPAHFRVVLDTSEQGRSADFERVAHRRNGYDSYVFRSGQRFESSNAVCDAFFIRVLGELDAHYRMSRARVQQLNLWNDAVDDTMSILEAYKSRGVSGWASRLWRGRKLRRAIIALGEAEVQQQQDKREFDRKTRAEYEVGSGLLKEVLRNQLDELEPHPVAPLSELLQLLDANRHTGREVLLATLASLIGAVVAAAATLIAAQ